MPRNHFPAVLFAAVLPLMAAIGCNRADGPDSKSAGTTAADAASESTKTGSSPDTKAGKKAGEKSKSESADTARVPADSKKTIRTGPPKAVAPAVKPVFQNVAQSAGIDFTYFNDMVYERFFLPEVMGGGAAWFDFDLDGDLDVYYANGCVLEDPVPGSKSHRNPMFMNLDAKSFVDVTTECGAGHEGYGQGLAVADFDADGFPDIYVTNFGANVLYRNNGDGTFEDVTETAGVGDALWGTSTAWFDADQDGLVDLYVCNYMNVTLQNKKVCSYNMRKGYCGPGDYEADPDRLYINRGDGTFIESLDDYGMTAENGKGLAMVIVDFDNDLRPEIYVANDMTPNFLFTRSDNPNVRSGVDRDKRYCEIGTTSGCAVSDMGLNEASMGVSCADFDGDGFPDMYLTHFYNAKNTLYHNLGGLMFVDDSKRTRVASTSIHTLGFGTIPLDYDGDGAFDLFIANGHVLGPYQSPNEMSPQLLRNDGRGRFDDISPFAGEYFVDLWLGRGAAACDFDNDGDTDFTVSHLDRPVALMRNDTRVENRWIGLDLRSANRVPPVGGRIVVTSGDINRVRPITAGGSYLSNHDPRMLFWLPDGDFTLEIHWPSGKIDRLANPESNRYHRIAEGQSPAAGS
jgi:hypothetical protein